MNQKCHCGRTLEAHCTRRWCTSCTSGYRCPRHGKDWAYRTGGGLFTSGATGSGATCRRCHKATVNCPWCKGRSGKTCSTCGGTGQTCATHGRNWR